MHCKNLRKVYGSLSTTPTIAVKDLNFGLSYGDCFALLGVNGAGKTSTFKMLTGDVIPSKGTMYIDGMNVRKNFKKVRKMIGYCPQYDALFMSLTVTEHLWFYCKIKKIPRKLRKDIVNKML